MVLNTYHTLGRRQIFMGFPSGCAETLINQGRSLWGSLKRYETTYDPHIGRASTPLEQEDGLGELSSICCDFCDTGPKRSLGFLGSKPLLRWVAATYNFFHKLMKICPQGHPARNLQPFVLQDRTALGTDSALRRFLCSFQKHS